jgi:hypothetical protein
MEEVIGKLCREKDYLSQVGKKPKVRIKNKKLRNACHRTAVRRQFLLFNLTFGLRFKPFFNRSSSLKRVDGSSPILLT